MLDYYRDEENIGVVTGNNFQQGHIRGNASYYFSKYPHCWGWATWKRAWQKYDHEMQLLADLSDEGVIRNYSCAEHECHYWKKVFERVRQNEINSWAYRWTFSTWKHTLLTVTLQKNLVKNIGFGPDATHTKAPNTSLAPLANSMSIEELVHPKLVVQHILADEFCARNHFKVAGSLLGRILRKLRLMSRI